MEEKFLSILEIMARKEINSLIGKKIGIMEKSGKQQIGIVSRIENDSIYFDNEKYWIKIDEIESYRFI
jgi:hypothetical protein